jgi:hypothetical protein
MSGHDTVEKGAFEKSTKVRILIEELRNGVY